MLTPEIQATLNELLLLGKQDPAKFKILLEQNPEIEKWLDALLSYDKARAGVSVEGFAVFYEAIYDRPLPYVDVPIVKAFVDAFHSKTGVMYESWRGKGKTTFLTAWAAYVIGVRPVGSTALVRINDRKAKESGKAIAEIISSNPGWRKVFPNVVPDHDTGWSVENGFFVKDTTITDKPNGQAIWRQMCLADHVAEPSLVCAGVESGAIIGMHPSNGMWFDDLHDIENTTSQAEMNRVVQIVRSNIVPTWFSVSGSPTLGVFCTPWSINPPDAYQVMLQTGLFQHMKLPIYRIDEDGELFPPRGVKIKATWPEIYSIEKLEEIYKANEADFDRMYLCDVENAKPRNFRFQSFPNNEIKWNSWPMVVGVDPVATVKGINAGGGISHFAMCYALKTPYNTIVIGDGVVEKCDAMEGEQHLIRAKRVYNTFQRASVEQDGAGAVFIGMVTRNPGLKVNPHRAGEIGRGSKQDRQYAFLQPLFANGTILVSDANTPYLNAVRLFLELFPNIDKESYLNDVGDSILLAVFDMPEVWTKTVTGGTDEKLAARANPKKRFNPWDGFQQHRGF